MTKFYVRESRRAPRSADRDARRPEPRDGDDQAAPAAEKKAPSFLAQVKAEFAGFLEDKEFVAAHEGAQAADELWPFVSKKLAQSFWNGVELGASGKLKPKTKPRRDPA